MTVQPRPTVAAGWLVERVESGEAYLCRGADTREQALSKAKWLRDFHREYRMSAGRVRVRRVLVQDLAPQHCPGHRMSECPWGDGSVQAEHCSCGRIEQLWPRATSLGN